MKIKTSVTQSKIACEAGVSQTTVSFVLNGKEKELNVAKETKELILSKAKKLGYFKKRKLNRKKTGNIGYLISPQINLSNLYYHKFFVGVEKASIESGKNILVETWRDSSSPLFWNNKVDGVIVAEDKLNKEEIKQIQKYVPVVLLNWSTESVICDMVVPDNTGGVREAFAYLYKLGHRRIGFFGLVSQKWGPSSESRNRERLQGYYLGLKDYKLSVNKEYLQLPLCKTRDIKEVEELVLRTLKKWGNLSKPPTALITYNDIYGLSFIKMAPSAGIKIPQDLSLIGFDNTIACHYVSPALSSIEHNMEEMGRLSVELLEKRIKEGKTSPFRKLTCGTELVIRESVAEVGER